MQIPLLGRTGIALVLVGFALDFIPGSIWRHDSSSLLISALLFALGILLLFAWSVTQFNRKSDGGRSRSQLPLTAWLGIALSFVGLSFYAAIQYWVDTRIIASWSDYRDSDEIVLLLSSMLSAIGLALVIGSFRQVRLPAKHELTPGFSLDVGSGGNLLAQKLPLKGRFSTLPQFGLLYAAITFLILLAFAALARSPHAPFGLLLISVLKPGAHINTNATENRAAIVRIDAQNRWYVNSRQVQREELSSAVKDALSRHRGRAVYVDPDLDLEVQQVVDAVDALQSLHVKIVLLTPKMKTRK